MKNMIPLLFTALLSFSGCTSGGTEMSPDSERLDIMGGQRSLPDAEVTPSELEPRAQWSKEVAMNWYRQEGPFLGFNYVPRTAVNQLEMWQEETWDPDTIDQELGWAAEIGFNTARVFLHDLVWEQDSNAFLDRIDSFLAIADKHGIRVMFVFFDGVWHPSPKPGQQPEPIPRVHNSQWVQSPGIEILSDPERYDALAPYIRGVISAFREDPRVVVWDLFNEPNNPNTLAYKELELTSEVKAERALDLLSQATQWALSVDPSQPITSGVWDGEWGVPDALSPINAFMLQKMDVVSFHTYAAKDLVLEQVTALKGYGRPLFCTEYIARPLGSTYANILPIFRDEMVSGYQWGFVNGRSQTIYPWWSWVVPGTEEADPWFHDLLRADGSYYDEAEITLIQETLETFRPGSNANEEGSNE